MALLHRIFALLPFLLGTALPCLPVVAALGQPPAQSPVSDQNLDKPDAPRSSEAALTLFADAAGFQNSQQFDLAAAEWKKFLTRFADDPKAVEARYYLAVCQIQEGDFEEAVANLREVVSAADKDFSRREEAYLNLGWAQYTLGLRNQPARLEEAARTLAKLLEEYPTGEKRDQALFFRGESLYQLGQRDEAAAAYAELVDKHPASTLRSDALYALGVAYEEGGQFDKASAIYDEFLSTYADHQLRTEVRMRKAETLLRQGDFSGAEKLFSAAAETPGFENADHARYRLGFCLAEQERFAEAARVFASIVKDTPDSTYVQDAEIAAGRAYYRAQDSAAAVDVFRRLEASASPHVAEAAHWHARILLDEGKAEEARQVVAAALPKATEHPMLSALKLDEADALYESPDTRRASIEAYLRIAREHRDDPLASKALYNAAYGAMEVGDYAQGLAVAKQFLATYSEDPLEPEVRKVMAECHLQLGQHREAAEAFADLAARGDPDASRYQVRLGLSLHLQQRYDEAIEVLQQVLESTQSQDEKAEAAYWLGRCYLSKQQYELAIKALERSREFEPDWRQADEVLLNLAIAMRQSQRLGDAKSTITKLITTYPASQVMEQARYRLAEFSYASQDYPIAIENYDQVIAGWPASKLVPFSLHGRGWSYLRSGRLREATADFTALLRDYPRHELAAQALYARAMSRHQAGEHQAALDDITALLASRPTTVDLADALHLRGLCQAALRDYAAAVQTFQELLDADPAYKNAVRVLYELAWAHKNGGDEAAAVDAFLRLLAADPASGPAAEARYHIAERLYEQKQFVEAADQYEQALQLSPTGDLLEKTLYKLAWSNYQAGRYEPALAAFDQQLEKNQAGGLAADAEFLRGECLLKLGRQEEALAAFERARDNPSPNEAMQVLTCLHAAQTAAALSQWQASLDWTAALNERFPDSPYLPQANYERAWALRNLGQFEEALKLFQQVTESSRNELGARARFMAGEVLFEQQQHEAALLEFRRVMFGYGGDKAPAGVRGWQAKAGLEAGRCAGVLAGQATDPATREKYITAARTFFRYVLEKHAETEAATAAREQLQRLGGK